MFTFQMEHGVTKMEVQITSAGKIQITNSKDKADFTNILENISVCPVLEGLGLRKFLI